MNEGRQRDTRYLPAVVPALRQLAVFHGADFHVWVIVPRTCGMWIKARGQWTPRRGKDLIGSFDSTGPMERPAHFVLVDWRNDLISAIRNFLFAPYVLESIDWVRLG